MSETPNRGPSCEASLRFLDSYMKSDHPADTDAEFLKHLEACPDCSREFAARSRIAEGLKRAVEGETPPPYLAAKIRQSIEEYEGRRGSPWQWARRLAPVTAALVICFGVWIAYQLGHLRLTSASQEAYIGTLSTRVAGILGVGLKDHVHCAYFCKLPEHPPSAPELIAGLGPEYGGLLPIVEAKVPGEYKVMMAHRCSYHGRKYVHLAFTGGSKLASLVITKKGAGEVFARDQLLPVLAESGIPLYRGSVQRFAIAGFESGGYLVYLVSDLGNEQNLAMLASLVKPVHALLAKLES